MADPTKPKASLAAAKTEVHEAASVKAARYFAMHGMKKVSHMLNEEMPASQTAEMKKKQSALKEQLNDQELSMPDDDDEGAAYKAQWKKVDAIRGVLRFAVDRHLAIGETYCAQLFSCW